MIRLISALLFFAVLTAVSGCLSPRVNINVTVDTSGVAQLTTLAQLQQVQECIEEYHYCPIKNPVKIAVWSYRLTRFL